MITSTHNPKIQLVRELLANPKARREARAFVIEGVRLVEEAQQAHWAPQLVLWSDDLSPRGRILVDRFAAEGVPVEPVDAAILKAASDTQAPQGIVAVVGVQPPALPANPNFLLLLDNLRDPGNLGAILRTAAAAGAQGVLLSPRCADPYNPKVVRSAMGAHFHLPIHPLPWAEIQTILQTCPQRLLADTDGDLNYTQADFRSPSVLIIGGEAEGAGPEAQQLATQRVFIPMPGQVESLNAAVAAGILLFEVARQRSVR